MIVELNTEEAEGYWEQDGEASLTSIVPVRSELATDDRRLLYLAWLLSVEAGELANDELEPAVPPGLARLSASLYSLVEFLRLDEDLLAVAAEASEPLSTIEPSTAELTRWVTRLPEQEKDTLLARLADGDPHLRMELSRRSRGETHPAPDGRGARTVAELEEAMGDRKDRLAALAAQAATEAPTLADVAPLLDACPHPRGAARGRAPGRTTGAARQAPARRRLPAGRARH